MRTDRNNFELSVDKTLPEGRYVSSIIETDPRNPRRKPSNRIRRDRRWLRRSVNVLMATLVGIMLLSVPASANPFTDAIKNAANDFTCRLEAHNARSQFYNSGVASLGLGRPIIYETAGITRGGDPEFDENRHTMFEKTWGAGTRWTLWTSNELTRERADEYLGLDREKVKAGDPLYSNECYPFVDIFTTNAGNFFLEGASIIVGITNWFYGQVYFPTWLDSLNETVSTMITGTSETAGLKDILYFEFLTLLLMMGALYMGWIGLVKKQSLKAGQDFLWMVGATLIGAFMMSNPLFILNGVKEVSTLVDSALITTAVSSVTQSATSDDSFCFVPAEIPTVITKAGNAYQGDAKRLQSLRITECSLWTAFVYAPWLAGQYGLTVGEADKLIGSEALSVNLGDGFEVKGSAPLKQLELQSFTVDAGARGENSLASLARERLWHETLPPILEQNPENSSTWTGLNGGFSRLGIGLTGLLVAFMGCLVIVILSGSMLLYSVGLTILTLVSPFFLLLGVGGFTRGITLRWAELFVSTVIKRMMLSVMLGITITLYAFIIGNASMTYLMSSFALIIIGIALLAYRKQLTGLVADVHFGGTGQNLTGAGQQMVGQGKAIGTSIVRSGSGVIATKGAGVAGAVLAGAGAGAGIGAGRQSVAMASHQEKLQSRTLAQAGKQSDKSRQQALKVAKIEAQQSSTIQDKPVGSTAQASTRKDKRAETNANPSQTQKERLSAQAEERAKLKEKLASNPVVDMPPLALPQRTPERTHERKLEDGTTLPLMSPEQGKSTPPVNIDDEGGKPPVVLPRTTPERKLADGTNLPLMSPEQGSPTPPPSPSTSTPPAPVPSPSPVPSASPTRSPFPSKGADAGKSDSGKKGDKPRTGGVDKKFTPVLPSPHRKGVSPSHTPRN